MGRFDHLEIGDWLPVHPEEPPENGRVIDEDYYLEKAKAAFAEENYEQSLSFYSRALQYEISLEEAWVGQIRCLIELRELQEAVIWSNRTLERFPNSSEVLSARAVAESRMGRLVQALAYSDSALGSPGCTAYSWVARGEVLIGVNPTNAKACFAKAVELSPSDWAVHSWIARAYMIRGCYHQALEHLRDATRLDSSLFTCWHWTGRCCEALGEVEEAKRAYARALAIQPKFSRSRKAVERLANRDPLSRLADGLRRIFKGS